LSHADSYIYSFTPKYLRMLESHNVGYGCRYVCGWVLYVCVCVCVQLFSSI